MTTVAEAAYLERVAALDCVLCRARPVEIHHLKAGTGLSQRSEHWLSVALCPACHRGANGLHGLGTKGFYTRYKLDELDLLARTIKALNARS